MFMNKKKTENLKRKVNLYNTLFLLPPLFSKRFDFDSLSIYLFQELVILTTMQDIIDNRFLLLELSYLDDDDDDGDTEFTTVSHSTSIDSFFDIHKSDFITTTTSSHHHNMGDKLKIANNFNSKSQKLAATIQKWCFKKFSKKSKVQLESDKVPLVISKDLHYSDDQFVYFDQSTELERNRNTATNQSIKHITNIVA